MDQASVADAVKQICDEKGIPVDAVIATIEAALAAAYRKDFGEKNQNVKVEFNLETGKSQIFDVKTVVEDLPPEQLEALKNEEAARDNAAESRPMRAETAPTADVPLRLGSEANDGVEGEEVRRFNPKTELQVSEAQALKKGAVVGDEIKTKLPVPGDFGRMAAQTAKQVIVQKLRETERQALFSEFKGREGEIVVGTVQRREGNLVLIDMGRITALLPPEEQIRSESYVPGGHVKVYIVAVNETTKGPEIVVSRSHPEIVKKLFALEIPEIANDIVQIKSIAREAGSRSKVAVWTDQENIDPIGSCIGQRGARIQTIISELKGEKVDIIKYSDDPTEYIANALSPAKILDIKVDESSHVATAEVAEDQLSLAIGRAGQNVRLAAKLTGWKIDIISHGGTKVEADEVDEDGEAPVVTPEKLSTEAVQTETTEVSDKKTTPKKKKSKAKTTSLAEPESKRTKKKKE